jgi:hypothetical protein
MPVPTSAVKVNPVTGALIDPPVATFAAANGLLTDGTSDAKNSVRAATTTNGTLATAFENGDTIDGIVLATSDRILIKNQSAPAENGIYVVAASGAPTRATDFDAWTEIVGAFVTVESGTVNAGTQWLCNVVAGGTLGTTAITFVVPKNYVDLTTTQTVTGAKTFNNITGSVIESTTIGVTAPAAGWFTLVNGLYISVGSGASLVISQDIGVSFDAPDTESIIIRSAASSDVTLPTSGTLLSTAAIGVSVQAYDADLTTWAGITPGANVGTFLATPSSANLLAAVTDETGTGALVFGTSPTFTTSVLIPDGTEALPGLRFSADTDTGFWREGANQMRAVVGGSGVCIFSNDGTTQSWGFATSLTKRTIATGEVHVAMQAFSGAIWGVRIGDPAAKTYIRAAAAQTANIMEWQNSAGTALTYISSAGALTVGSTLAVTGATTLTGALDCASSSYTAFAGATTLLTIGGTGASASMFAPSTLDATSSITGAIRTSGGISAAKALNIGTNATIGGNVIGATTTQLQFSSDTSLRRVAAGVLASYDAGGGKANFDAASYRVDGAGTFGSYGLALRTSTMQLTAGSSSVLKWSNNVDSLAGSYDTGLARDSAGVVRVTDGSTGRGALKTGSLTVGTAGTSVANIRHGVSGTMTLGVVTVTDTGCTANTRYFFTTATLGTITAPSTYWASTRTASTSFVITSNQLTETGTVHWLAIEP